MHELSFWWYSVTQIWVYIQLGALCRRQMEAVDQTSIAINKDCVNFFYSYDCVCTTMWPVERELHWPSTPNIIQLQSAASMYCYYHHKELLLLIVFGYQHSYSTRCARPRCQYLVTLNFAFFTAVLPLPGTHSTV